MFKSYLYFSMNCPFISLANSFFVPFVMLIVAVFHTVSTFYLCELQIFSPRVSFSAFNFIYAVFSMSNVFIFMCLWLNLSLLLWFLGFVSYLKAPFVTKKIPYIFLIILWSQFHILFNTI